MPRAIQVQIDPDGDVLISFECVDGLTCEGVTDFLEDALGDVVSEWKGTNMNGAVCLEDEPVAQVRVSL